MGDSPAAPRFHHQIFEDLELLGSSEHIRGLWRRFSHGSRFARNGILALIANFAGFGVFPFFVFYRIACCHVFECLWVCLFVRLCSYFLAIADSFLPVSVVHVFLTRAVEISMSFRTQPGKVPGVCVGEKGSVSVSRNMCTHSCNRMCACKFSRGYVSVYFFSCTT